MSVPYQPWEDFFSWIPEPNRSRCLRMIVENQTAIQKARGSAHNHQAWRGGWLDHLQETLNIAYVLFVYLDNQRRLPFSFSTIYLVLLLHDFEKPWKYEQEGRKWVIRPEFRDRAKVHQFKLDLIKKYRIQLTAEQRNAFDYIEGEIGNYSPHKRGMGPLAAFCHMCDIASARLWPNHPLKENDPWLLCDRHSYRGKKSKRR